ncbi:MAG TPA: hypothetical protein VLG50_00050 [Candidatus Saccharimonadales bacterium]|nr:hypothetical protein [Candidatus Saccharimonadales bacterium]
MIKRLTTSITVLLLICSNTEYSMARRFTSKLPKSVQSYLPKVFAGYQSPSTITPTYIQSWLQAQNPIIQNKISQHVFFKDLMSDLENPLKINAPLNINPAIQQRTIIRQEIFMYCMLHPEESEEIMNFYQEMKNAQSLIEQRLQLLPAHAQQFFKQQVQKYMASDLLYDQSFNKHWAKEKISRLNSYVVTAIALGFSILTYLVYFFLEYDISLVFDVWRYGRLDVTNPQEKQLLEIFNLLVDALNLEPIALRKGPGILGTFGSYLPFFQFVEVGFDFFELSLEAQILTLLHELRHYQQDTLIVIPADVVEYAKSCGVQPYSFDIAVFFMTGFFWSRAMLEVDADLFSAQQMKEHKWVSSAVNSTRYPWFNPESGYLANEMMLQDAKHPNRSPFLINIEKKWSNFLSKQYGENIYLRYVPQHLKEAAAKNRATKIEPNVQAKDLYEQINI